MSTSTEIDRVIKGFYCISISFSVMDTPEFLKNMSYFHHRLVVWQKSIV